MQSNSSNLRVWWFTSILPPSHHRTWPWHREEMGNWEK